MKKDKIWVFPYLIAVCLLVTSLLTQKAEAETILLGNGQVLEVLFSAISNKREITCAGKINGKYLSGNAIAISGSKLFTPLSDDLKILKSKLKSSITAAAKIKVQKKIDKLKLQMKNENKVCSYGPEAAPGTSPGTLPTSTPQPTATPTPSVSGNFDSSGNVTSNGKITFGIPSNLNASREIGRAIWSSTCDGCHDVEKTGHSFSFYKSVIRESPMYIFDKTDQDIANITAYLRRFELN
jgi:hypothetical protein